MTELQRLCAEHASAVLSFELANRAYFAKAIADRGDDFFANFAEHFNEMLAAQENGAGAFHVLVGEDGAVMGRFNIFELHDDAGVLGYRVDEGVSGRGVATATVRDLCRLARDRYGLRTLRAATSSQNVASQRVLVKVGFIAIGPAEPGGRPGTWYERDLTND